MLTKQQACFQGHVTRKEHGALLRNSADSGETDSNLAKACCFTSFTSLGQQKQQVFMYICYILWQSLLILATCLKYPLTNVIVIEACKYGSHKWTPLAFWDYFIIHFFYHFNSLHCLVCLTSILGFTPAELKREIFLFPFLSCLSYPTVTLLWFKFSGALFLCKLHGIQLHSVFLIFTRHFFRMKEFTFWTLGYLYSCLHLIHILLFSWEKRKSIHNVWCSIL